MTVRCLIVPPYMLQALAQSDDPELAARARTALQHLDEVTAARRGVPGAAGTPYPRVTPPRTAAGDDTPQRTIGDAKGKQTTPGTTVRTEGQAASGDVAVDEAYDGLGDTWTFYASVFQRKSIDDKGLPLLATVHYGEQYDNAFWDGAQMVFGDGDGKVFGRFTTSLDVIGHELTHGVTQFTAGLNYQGQSGALNESVSDVFGSLVRQYKFGQAATAADWLIGAQLLLPSVKGRALRDMLHPGTAYDDPNLGKDPQPADMAGYVETEDDNGGVHINSGIPNRAFALAATSLGGNAWETVGPVWYAALTGDGIKADCDFATFAGLTMAAAEAGSGGSKVVDAVRSAWLTVGVLKASGSGLGSGSSSRTGSSGSGSLSGAGSHGRVTQQFLLRRSGGLAGLTTERRVRLDDLPDDDTSAWEMLLASPTLRELAAEQLATRGRPVADAFMYSVIDDKADLRVTMAEPSLPDDIRSLFERTLRG